MQPSSLGAPWQQNTNPALNCGGDPAPSLLASCVSIDNDDEGKLSSQHSDRRLLQRMRPEPSLLANELVDLARVAINGVTSRKDAQALLAAGQVEVCPSDVRKAFSQPAQLGVSTLF